MAANNYSITWPSGLTETWESDEGIEMFIRTHWGDMDPSEFGVKIVRTDGDAPAPAPEPEPQAELNFEGEQGEETQSEPQDPAA